MNYFLLYFWLPYGMQNNAWSYNIMGSKSWNIFLIQLLYSMRYYLCVCACVVYILYDCTYKCHTCPNLLLIDWICTFSM